MSSKAYLSNVSLEEGDRARVRGTESIGVKLLQTNADVPLKKSGFSEESSLLAKGIIRVGAANAAQLQCDHLKVNDALG